MSKAIAPDLTRLTALFGLLALAGCGAPPVVFDRANLASVRHIGVLAPGFPAGPTVAVLPPTNGALFLIVNSVQEGNRSREFAEILTRAKSNPEAVFSDALMDCLRKADMQPTALPADARRKSLLQDSGSSGAEGVDAVLDVVVTRYGYYAVVNSQPFLPNIVMKARLVDTRAHSVLMEDTITMVNVAPADPTMTGAFQNYSDIAANPDGAARALDSAMGPAASSVCKRLI